MARLYNGVLLSGKKNDIFKFACKLMEPVKIILSELTQTDLGCSMPTDSDMTFGCHIVLDVTIASSGNTGHLDHYGFGGIMALKQQCSFWWYPRP